MASIEVNDRAVRKHLKDVEKRSKRLKPAMDQVAKQLHRAVEDSFDREGNHDGFPRWKKRKPRGKKRDRHPMLNKSGKLKRSLRPVATDTEAAVETDVGYAGFQNDGTRNMAARPFLQINDADLEKAGDTMLTYIDEGKVGS